MPSCGRAVAVGSGTSPAAHESSAARLAPRADRPRAAAMECRQLHNSAQEDAKALRSLELGAASEADASRLILSLASHIRRLQTAATSLPDAQRSMWDQRTGWAHQELTQLTSERLRDPASGAPDPDAVVRLVYACADAVGAVDAGKASAEAALARETTARVVAEARAASLEESARGSEAAAETAAAATRELLELRTKAVVQQQETQRRAQDLRDLQQRLQAVTRERDEMAAHVSRGTGAGAGAGGGGGNRTRDTAVDDDASPGETFGADRLAALTAERDKLLEANHVLSVNLRQHGEVVEKLIGLNSELMDRANEERAARDPEVLAKQKELEEAREARIGLEAEAVVVVDDEDDEDIEPEYDADGNWIGEPGGMLGKIGSFMAGSGGGGGGATDGEAGDAEPPTKEAAALPV